jgi:hypothetical protein
VFDLLKVFHDVSGEELKRGILIAIELDESEIMADAQSKQ